MIFNMVGGGAALNFKIIGGTAHPENPAENTIWINTDAAVTCWAFSASEPQAEEGMVWIRVGSYSPAAFNALKKNGIMIYPMSAEQYINGAWVAKDAESYQNGAWNAWIMYLFQNGDQNEAVTGGWSNSLDDYSADGWSRDKAAEPDASSISIGNTMVLNLRIGDNYNYADAAAVGTRNAIDLTEYSKIKAVCNMRSMAGNSEGVVRLAIHTSLITPHNASSITAYTDIPEGASTVELDVSGINGLNHILIGGISGNVGYDLTVSEVRIE